MSVLGFDRDVSMNGINRDFKIIKHFKRKTSAAYLGIAFNLVTLKHPKIQKVLQEEITLSGGDAVINVQFQKKITFLDGLVSLLTAMIYNMETLEIEGDIIKFN